MSNIVRAHIFVEGRVQGVAYRAFAYDRATRGGVAGWVQNLTDGRVELEVEGAQPSIDQFLSALRQGPSLARVDHIQVEWLTPTGKAERFQIVG